MPSPSDVMSGKNTGAGRAQRRIFALMAFAVIFSLTGEEIKQIEKTSSGWGNLLSPAAKILLGGTVATSILMFAAEFGAGGAQLGEGLAGVACVTAMFVEGGPVWDAMSNIMGGKATTPTSPTLPTMYTVPGAQGEPGGVALGPPNPKA